MNAAKPIKTYQSAKKDADKARRRASEQLRYLEIAMENDGPKDGSSIHHSTKVRSEVKRKAKHAFEAAEAYVRKAKNAVDAAQEAEIQAKHDAQSANHYKSIVDPELTTKSEEYDKAKDNENKAPPYQSNRRERARKARWAAYEAKEKAKEKALRATELANEANKVAEDAAEYLYKANKVLKEAQVAYNKYVETAKEAGVGTVTKIDTNSVSTFADPHPKDDDSSHHSMDSAALQL